MKDKEPLIIILVIFILLGLAWDPIKQSGGAASFFSSPFANETTPTPSSTNNAPTSYESPSSPTATEKQSPYYGKISISYTSTLNNSNPNSEYIALYPLLDAGEKVDITGWKLQSERSGNWVKIGKASTLPLPSSPQTYQDVVVRQGDTVYIVKGFSPINLSFKTNECTGYFEQDRQFYPPLRRSCPLARDENLPQFSTDLDRDDECRQIIETIPACYTPTGVININRLPDTVSASCKEYLSTSINYNSCVATHIGDKNFAGKEWYVYLNIFGPLWRDKLEKINLYDNQGLLVSSYSY